MVKTFSAEFDKPKVRFGYLKNQRLESADIMALADLPSIDVLRGETAGGDHGAGDEAGERCSTLRATQLARVLQARVDKGDQTVKNSGE